jgi:hypothetical protein
MTKCGLNVMLDRRVKLQLCEIVFMPVWSAAT